MIVLVGVGVLFDRSSRYQRTVNTVGLLMTGVGMIEMRSFVVGMERVTELGTESDRALRDVRNAVHELRVDLANAVPVERGSCALRLVREVDHDDIIPADVNARTRKLEIYAQIAAKNTVAEGAILVEASVGIAQRAVAACSTNLNSIVN